jgi:3-phenylpropionate/cinnamic acid dioxygenase small subunit
VIAPPDDAAAAAVAQRFLIREARLLDDDRFADWLGLLAPGIAIRVPVRQTRTVGPASEFSATTFHLDEDRYSLEMRVARLATDYAWAENPRSRCRRFVSNVDARFRTPAELAVDSYLLLYRTRGDGGVHEMLTGRREDVLVDAGAGFHLLARTVYLDQTTLPISSLSVFL